MCRVFLNTANMALYLGGGVVRIGSSGFTSGSAVACTEADIFVGILLGGREEASICDER